MAKVLQLTSAHTAKDVRIFLKTACSLARAGHDVTLLAPNAQNETKDKVRIKGFAIPAGRLARVFLGPFIIARATFRENPDIVHFHDPDVIPVGLLMRLFGKKVVYDVHEDFAAAAMDRRWIPKILRPVVGAVVAIMEQAAVRIFSATVAATPRIARRFPASRTITTNNYPLPSEIPDGERQAVAETCTSFVYVGGISRERGILQALKACQIVAARRGVTLELAGGIPDKSLQEEILGGEYQSVLNYHGFIDRQEMARLLLSSVAGIVTFLPLPNHIDSRPNKMFEYLSFGLPVIASNFPAWREIIEDHDCGICIDPESPEDLAKAMQYFLDNPAHGLEMGRKGKELVRKKWNWGIEEKKLVELYAKLAGPQTANKGRL